MNKASKKTLVKATILIAIFSLFLEITWQKIFSYLIFLSIYYILLFLYIKIKQSIKFEIKQDYIFIDRKFLSITLPYSEIITVFTVSGFLQRLFKLDSVYIISKKGNYVLKDLENGCEVENLIKERIIAIVNKSEMTT
ncbi:MAG: hypothetical protein QXU18_02740 [Thermoplasmatales archaeon]